MLATTQTAERAYASRASPAQVSVTATVGAGSRLDWMPQETILYPVLAPDPPHQIDLAADAECLLAETVILGRLAMGETLTHAHLTDHRLVTRQAARSGPKACT